jgi:hypothetical protein
VGNAYDRLTCGGSLVAPTIVITAAHCFYLSGYGFDDPDFYATVTGRTQLSSSAGQEVPIETYYVFTDGAGNPLYNPATDRWDVVVVELGSASGATPIKVAGPDETATWAPGSTAYVSGWGTTAEDSLPSDGLRAARVGILSDSSCAGPYGGDFFADVMLCAGLLTGGADACYGDSGGPLTVPIAGGGVRLVGDVSWGVGCGRSGYPGVYGRLASDPIRSSLQNAVQQVAGVNIVGSGAQPPAAAPPTPTSPPIPPTSPSAGITPAQALELAWKLSKQQCSRFNSCRRYWAGQCKQYGDGAACWIRTLDRDRRGRKSSCRRRVLWSVSGGQIRRSFLGRWRCRRGW